MKDLLRSSKGAKLAGATLLLLIIGCLGWLGIRGGLAVKHLANAKNSIQVIQDRYATAFDRGSSPATADQSAQAAAKQTHAAASLTSDPIWAAASHLPWAGRYFSVLGDTSKAADLVVRQALPPALQAARILGPVRAAIHNGTVPIQSFRLAAPLIGTAASYVDRASSLLTQAPRTKIGPLDRAVANFRRQLASVRSRVDDANTAAQLAPAMLGGDGIRRYFVGFLTNAESRTAGGLLGSYAILRADHGHLSFEHFGSATELRDSATPAIDLGAEFNNVYSFSDALKSWRDAPVAAHFPNVGQIWEALWQRQSGQHLDGVIATDPVALSHVLAVTGAAKLKTGEEITGDNVVGLVERDIYARFNDNSTRDAFFVDIAKASSERLLNNDAPGSRLIGALAMAVGEQRLKIWSARDTEEALINRAPFGGTLPAPGSPLAYLTVNNSVGGKMDFYLKRKVVYTPAACGQGAIIKLTLINTTPDHGLPSYVTLIADPAYQHVPLGTNVLTTTLYLDKDQILASADLDGKSASLRQFSERGLSAVSTVVVIKPGTSTTLTVILAPKKSNDPVRIPVQPLVYPQESRVLAPMRCG